MRLAIGLLSLLPGCATQLVSPEAGVEGLDLRRFDMVRVVSWNIETVGSPGSNEYDAALEVLARLDADVVGLMEIANSNDDANLASFAADAGYPEVAIGTVEFGGDHQAVLSRRTMLDVQIPTAADLSGDFRAKDVTRDFVRADIDTAGDPLTVVVGHWKCCGTDTDEFRRVVDARRSVQVIDGLDPALDPILIMGDVNEDPDDLPLSPAVFNSLPAGLPSSYFLGQDLFDEMIQVGLDNDPFAPYAGAGLIETGATQRDGDTATFINSSSALDHGFVSPAIRLSGAEVFDDDDEGLPSVLHLTTPDLSAGTVEDASDHHPLVLEVGVHR